MVGSSSASVSYPLEWASTQRTCRHTGTVLEQLSKGDFESRISSAKEAEVIDIFRDNDPENTGRIPNSCVRAALQKLGVRLDDNLFKRLVSSRLDMIPEGALSVESFLSIYCIAVAPKDAFGPHLRKAAGRGEVALVRELILRDCNPNCGDGRGMTCLHNAASFGSVDVARELLELCGDDLIIDAADKSGWTPLMTASSNGNLPFVRWLLISGANVNVVNNVGRSALHLAASKGRDSCVRFLIAKGADVNGQDDAGWTPLGLAAMHGHFTTAKSLLDGGALDSVVDQLGYNPSRYCDERTWQKLVEDRMQGSRK